MLGIWITISCQKLVELKFYVDIFIVLFCFLKLILERLFVSFFFIFVIFPVNVKVFCYHYNLCILYLNTRHMFLKRHIIIYIWEHYVLGFTEVIKKQNICFENASKINGNSWSCDKYCRCCCATVVARLSCDYMEANLNNPFMNIELPLL